MNDRRAAGAAFLLSQLGAHVARRFAERVAVLDITPPQAGLLRAVAQEPGRSQQALAAHLGTPATRLVALVDALEQRGALQRRRNRDDRRLHAVHLTPAGEALLRDVRTLAAEHETDLLAALKPDERDALADLLSRVGPAEVPPRVFIPDAGNSRPHRYEGLAAPRRTNLDTKGRHG